MKKLILLSYLPLQKIIVMEAKAFTLQLPQTPPLQFNTMGEKVVLFPEDFESDRKLSQPEIIPGSGEHGLCLKHA